MATMAGQTGKLTGGRDLAIPANLPGKHSYSPEYQELKFALHRKLLDRVNLETLSSMAGERVRTEIRGALARLIDEERTPLSLGGEGPGDRRSTERGLRPGAWSRCSRIPP
jgi:pilus assembly protein CpaF